MPDNLAQGSDFDDDGMQLPHLEPDQIDRNGIPGPLWEPATEREQAMEENRLDQNAPWYSYQHTKRPPTLDETMANIESFRPVGYVERHIEPVNRREQALQSDDADYLPTDEDMENNDEQL